MNKAQHQAGSECTTSRVMLCRHVIYLCATTAAQNGQEKMFQLSLPVSESLLVVKHAAYLTFWLENHIQVSKYGRALFALEKQEQWDSNLVF